MRISGLVIAALTVMAVTGCKDKSGNNDSTLNEEAEGTERQDYSAEKNIVKVEKLEYRTFHKQLICNGRVEASEKSKLQFAANGTIAAICVREGQHVSKGEVIASLDKVQLKEQFESASLAFEKAKLSLADRLLDYGYNLNDTATIPADVKRTIYINTGFTDSEMAYNRARRDFENADLKAPFSGKIASITGILHEQGGAFCTLIADQTLNVHFSILETEYKLVKVGQAIQISPFVDEEKVIRGSVTSVNPTVDQNGQIQVTAKVANDGSLLDGMNVRIIVENDVPHQLVVSKNAVLIRDNKEVLFRYVDGKSVWTYVHVLMSNSTEHVVEANTDRGAELNPGDLIIVSGNLNLGDETSVELAE